MENLFMQVFDRRDWVTAQMQQQVDSHAESLAYTLLAAGHRPPPWLFPSCADQSQEFNGRPIVSELLFHGSQITTPATNRTVFQPPVVRGTSFRTVEIPNGDTCIETVCATLETNQHEEPEQKQTSDNQEFAEASEVNIFSMVQRSRSRQKRIEDHLHEKNKAANSGSSDGMLENMQRSRLSTEGSNKTNALLASKPCGDGAKNTSTTTSLPGQEYGFHANQGRSTESLKCINNGDQGVLLDSSQPLVLENQISSPDNNVKVSNNCSARNFQGVRATNIADHPLSETHLLVEPKKLQFDGVESVCMNPESEQTMQQAGIAMENADPHLDEAHLLNEDPSSTSCSKVHCSLGRSLLGGIQSGYLNPDSAPAKPNPKAALGSVIFDLPGMHSRKEDPFPACSSEVPNPMSGPLLENSTQCTSPCNSVEGPCSKVSPLLETEKLNSTETKYFQRSCSPVSQLVERDTLQTVEDTERVRVFDGFSDQVVTWNSKSLVQRSSDLDVLHHPYSQYLQLSKLANTSSGAPSSSGILADSLIGEDGCEDLSHSLINDTNSQCAQAKSSVYSEQLQPHTVIMADIYQPSVSCYKTQSDTAHSDDCPVVNTCLSAGNELSQEQYFSSGPSLQSDKKLVHEGTLLGHHAPCSENEKLNEHSENDAVTSHPGKPSDIQVKLSALTEACDITVRNERDEYVVPEVVSSIEAIRTSKMHTTKGNSMTSAEKWTGKVPQDGTEQDASLLEDAVQINVNSCTAENDKPIKSSQPSVDYFVRSTSSHEKISMLQSDISRPTCDQKRSVGDIVQVNCGLSSKRRRIGCQSDVSLSRTPCAKSLSLNNQVGSSGHRLTVANFSEKSQPSGCNLTSSASCEIMSLESEGIDDSRNHKTSMASDIYGNGNSSRRRRNTTSLSDVALHNSPNASSRRNAIEEGVFEIFQEQIQNNLEVSFLTAAALPSCSGILSDNETNCTQEEYTGLEGQDLNVNNVSVADDEMALRMDNMSSHNVTLSPENYSERGSFTIFLSYAVAQHGERASAPNALLHGKLGHDSNVELGRKYKSYDPKRHLLSGTPISRKLGDDYVDCDETMPEIESFDIPVQFDSPTIGQRTLEGLFDSRKLATFSSDLANYSSHGDLQQYRASITDSFGEYGLGLDGSFIISDAIAPSTSNPSDIQEISETPLTPSVEKYSLGKLSSRSGSSSEHMGSIPELECFRIDEVSSIAEEHEYQDRLPGSVDAECSPSGRQVLQDITGLCQNDRNSASLSTRCTDKCNKGLTSETFSSELSHHSNIRNGFSVSKLKVNHSTSVKRQGKVSRSLHNRLSKTDLLDSRNGRHMSEANVGRRSKPSNIVANVTSFIPLVKPKLQPTTACDGPDKWGCCLVVKKDVTVKALKVAEAAKRLEEKKQKDQEMRKAAAKLERERLKQEKELKQKLEEEQKKKREVDLATKKRQREEVEKKEMTRKRKCIDGARKQQKQPMDKRCTAKDEKDASRKASDNMDPGRNFVDVGKSQVKPESTTEPALRCITEKCNYENGLPVDERHLSFGSHAKENTPTILEESYEMSPCKDSDEEDDDLEREQESRRRKKFVPSWAWKENLDKILLSNMSLDPRKIFAQKCSFNISDVLCPRIPQRGFR